MLTASRVTRGWLSRYKSAVVPSGLPSSSKSTESWGGGGTGGRVAVASGEGASSSAVGERVTVGGGSALGLDVGAPQGATRRPRAIPHDRASVPFICLHVSASRGGARPGPQQTGGPKRSALRRVGASLGSESSFRGRPRHRGETQPGS